MTMRPANAVVVGANGRLGAALRRALAARGINVATPDRATVEGWLATPAELVVRDWLEAHAARAATVFVAAGAIDSGRPAAELEAANLHLPRVVSEAALAQGCRVVTFGSVMEGLLKPDTMNPYLRSKHAFANWAAVAIDRGEPLLHLRMHTLYGGGAPAPFMFFGQAFEAIRSGARFSMTRGRQLREFHHVDDECAAILRLVDQTREGVIGISHHEPVRLADIARFVFEALGRADLLGMGDLADPTVDNYGVVFTRTAGLDGIEFRPTPAGVLGWFREHLDRP